MCEVGVASKPVGAGLVSQLRRVLKVNDHVKSAPTRQSLDGLPIHAVLEEHALHLEGNQPKSREMGHSHSHEEKEVHDVSEIQDNRDNVYRKWVLTFFMSNFRASSAVPLRFLFFCAAPHTSTNTAHQR